MSFSEHHYKDYGDELFEYDDAPVGNGTGGTGGTGTGTGAGTGTGTENCSSSSSTSRAAVTVKPTTPSPDRQSSPRFASEVSMDLSDLQDVLGGEDVTTTSSDRLTLGSMYRSNNNNNSFSPWHQQQFQQMNQLGNVEENSDADSDRGSDGDDDNEGDGYSNYRDNVRGVHSSTLKFDDEIQEDCFQQSNNNDYSSFSSTSSFAAAGEHRQHQQQQKLSTLHEQEESGSSKSTSTSSLVPASASASSSSSSLAGPLSDHHSCLNGSSVNNINRRRKVKFEASSRLEHIQEFEKPDNEDFHMLYYTAHELQKMIDTNRAEEQRERNIVR